MIVDSNQQPKSLHQKAEIVIIGAGPVGLLLADELSSIASVVVIERGGLPNATRKFSDLNAEATGIDYPFKDTRDCGLGGSTSIWAGYCAIFDEHDFQYRDWVFGSGWPIKAMDIIPYYNKAAARLNIAESGFDSHEALTRTGITQHFISNKMKPTIWRFGNPTYRIDEQHIEQYANSDRVQIVLNACVTELALDQSHQGISHINIQNRLGDTGSIQANQFILATGGLEAPRLLLNSNKQLACGVANSSGAVGRYFMEHPHFPIDMLEITNEAHFKGWVERAQYPPNGEFLSCMGVTSNVQAAEGLLNARAHAYRTPNMSIEDTPKIGLFMEQEPNADSRLTLADSVDSFGMKRIRLNWQISDLDKYSVERYSKLFSEIFIASNSARPTKEYNAHQIIDQVLYSNHQLGTTRMSLNPMHGVVDENCKAHDLNNLYISGGGVFPTVSWANPTFTLLSLTYRLSDHIKAQHSIK